jgi:xanthine dehydrogenase accessory factor
MQEVFSEAVQLLGKGDQVVVATVVRTKGSTPQKPGAKLLIRKDGSGVGTLGGGCVEGDIWYAAQQLLKSGGDVEYREYALNEELAAEDGLVCGGTMYFLIDPIYRPEEYLPYAREIDSAYKGGTPVSIASLIKPAEGFDTSIGAKLFIHENGATEGTLGSTELDREAVEKAYGLMVHGRNEYVTSEHGAEYFVEAYTTPPQLVVCGGGHVSKAIAPLAKSLGFWLFVTDDRAEFVSEERFPEADERVEATPEEALPKLPINANTFIVIATRGHRYDNVALEAALRTPAQYVGLLGSLRKTILIYEDLLRNGVPVERVKEVRSPIGLDVHARTPEEIAVSIMAEALMFRLGGTGTPLKIEERRIDRLAQKVQAEAVPAAD